MQTSIVKALIVGFITSINVANAACGNFDTCRCAMADGSNINEITGQACRAYHTAAGLDSEKGATAYTVFAQNNEITFCQGGTIGSLQDYVPIDSCEMLRHCVGAGATGMDPVCSDPQ
ncbi:hypothetical protein LY76DRAFT_527881 [Colletotrichum caudatum]|nr:hypothetical protein LY76DRAFT_527881 [Colletotrichum caudatum]